MVQDITPDNNEMRVSRSRRPAKGLKLPDHAPWPEPVDGIPLLDDLIGLFRRHLALAPGASDAMALWVLFAHSFDAWEVSPRLAFVSPVPECGKTTALSILGALVPRPLMASNISPAVVFRAVDAARPTLVIDEADTFLDGSDGLNGILNSGHTRAMAFVYRCVGENYDPQGFTTWAPLAIAKIGKLSPTLQSRSIEIPMRRKRPDELAEPFKAAHNEEVHRLARMAARWVKDNLDALRISDPRMPDDLNNRARDNWLPLIAIADQVGGRWPERARMAAFSLSRVTDDPSVGVALLSDIREIFERRQVDRLASGGLCTELRQMEERPWSEYGGNGSWIRPKQLALLLRPFGILPKSVRIGENTPKGYLLDDFEDAFARYLPRGSANATPQQSSNSADMGEGASAAVFTDVAVSTFGDPLDIHACCGVADNTAQREAGSDPTDREA